MNEKKKETVLIVHNYYQIPGGEDTVVVNEKKMLEENGHKIFLYTRHNDELKYMSFLRKMILPFSTVFNIRTYVDIRKIIKDNNIEIVHVHNTLNLISPAVYYAAISRKTPVVQTVHNFRLLCPGAIFYRGGHVCEDCVDKGLKCAIKNKCYRGSGLQTALCVFNTYFHRRTGILKKISYICLTDFNREKLIKNKYIDSSKVFLKPNFAFEDSCKKIAEKERSGYLFIGRIEEIKGVRLLFQAFRKLPQLTLLLAGQGPLKDEMKDINNIISLGQVPHDDLINIIGDVKAVILPSQCYEGFPMVIVEAFSMGTPMIVGDIGNNGSLVKDGYNGKKFVYNSVNDLIDAIMYFENNNTESLRKNAYNDYQRFYSSKSNYLLLKEIYDCVYTN